jgi:hypothetical protein
LVASATASSSSRFGHRHVGALGKPDPRQRGLRRVAQMLLLAGSTPEAERMSVMRLRGERDVVGGRKIRQQAGDLERTRQPEPAALIGRQPGDVAAGKMNRTGIRHQLPGQLADQRGLAGAVGADDGVQFAPGDIEREIVGGVDAAEAADQVFNAEQGI